MPLQDHMQLISVDDHVIEHAKVWEDRLPRKYASVGPKVIEVQQETTDYYGRTAVKGQQIWQYEGRLYSQLGLNAVAGKPPEQWSKDPLRFEDMRRGCYDPAERIKDMDEDGVHGSLCFPNLPRFGGTMFQDSTDMDLAVLCQQAWNDFMIDEWCAQAPDRLIPLSVSPYWDIDAAVKEIHRVAGRGARALTFPENPVPFGLPSFHSPHWDPVWNALEETETPLCLHFGSSGVNPTTGPDAPIAVLLTLMGTNSMFAAADLLFSPMFTRHPKLKVALSEGGIGWVPYILERADYTWERQRFYQDIDQDRRPSEVFREHVWFCFISDEFGTKNIDSIGVDRVTWECDYPHSDCNWPNSRKVAAEQLRELPDEDAWKIAELNARELFRFPR
jgi:predicted TIM-barrel fold metal-dependent hydrolase